MTDSILDWLANRMKQPRESKTRATRGRGRLLTARHYQIAADWLNAKPLKIIEADNGIHHPNIYRTVKLFGLPLRRTK